ncbi:MAG: hypothetical protein IH628_17310, partial [Proteobacteria bacterium]|nr:hypothetical protein [Pseudomonadota bacterium]
MSRRHGGLFFIIGSLSFVLLGYQISLMRILSYVQWYHFAAMIISVALLGFGGAGTVLSLFRKRAMVRAEAIMYGGSIICLVLTALTPLSLSWISIDPF